MSKQKKISKNNENTKDIDTKWQEGMLEYVSINDEREVIEILNIKQNTIDNYDESEDW